jgi:hypothetical protein
VADQTPLQHTTAADQTPHHHQGTLYTASLTRGAPIRQKAADYFYADNSTTGLRHPQHRVFLVYTPETTTFNPNSGATDILIRQQDSDALQNLHYFTTANPAPAFYVANNTIIYPYALGTLHPPNTTLTIQAYAFKDEDLADNLFSLAPLLNQGCTATFTGQFCSITGPRNEGHQLIFYGTKGPYANAWKFSLSRPNRYKANTIFRHETHAEIALYASAVFGNPTFKTLASALRKQGTGAFVIKYLDSNVVAIVAEPTVSSCVGLLQGLRGAGGHGFNVDVLFVDRD